MSSIENLLLSLQLSILEKIDGKDPIVNIIKDGNSLYFENKLGKTFIVDIPKGDKGEQGLKGDKGEQGLKGDKGEQGLKGDKGEQGLKGDKGEQGLKGDKGERGLTGKTGIKGDPGEQGSQGEQGPRGNGIIDIKFDQRGHLIITTTDKVFDLGLLRSSGGGGGVVEEFTYSNSLPMPFAVGGLIAGTVFDKMPLKEIFTKLFYGYDYPYFSDFIIGDIFIELEVGEPINAGTYPALWLIANSQLLRPNTIEIKYVNNNLVLGDNIADTGRYDINLPEIRFNVPTSIVFLISAQDTTGIIFNKTYSIPVKARIFVGESIENTMSQEVLLSLRIRELKDDINGEYVLNEGGYKWFCYPAFMGIRDEFFDLDMQEAIAMEQQQTVSLVNEYGVTQDYLCYRSFNILNGDIRIEVK